MLGDDDAAFLAITLSELLGERGIGFVLVMVDVGVEPADGGELCMFSDMTDPSIENALAHALERHKSGAGNRFAAQVTPSPTETEKH